MFNMGIGEIFLIFVVLVLVVGPDKLPGFAKSIAKYLGEFNKAKNEIKHAVLSPSDEAEFRSLMHGNNGVVERKAKEWMGVGEEGDVLSSHSREDGNLDSGGMDPRVRGEDRNGMDPRLRGEDRGVKHG